MDGMIFDIQRFSVHDGPGIRTTVFMKGCPLRCMWCHNPEGLAAHQELQYFEDKCIGCGRCGNRESLTDAGKCPSGALKVTGRRISAEEAHAQIMKDRVFYQSDGGVTFSGGECLLQADFVREVSALSKKEGISTAIDTCGCVPWEAIEKTLSVCDMYLYDVKCITSETHKRFTGKDNHLILENLVRLSKCEKSILIRVPVIPGFNDSISEMEKTASFLSALANIQSVTFMPYHTLGAGKYKTLGKENPFQTDQRISDSFLSSVKAVFEYHQLPIQA